MVATTSRLRDRVNQVVREYDAQGWHRTGTDADHASARWLAEQVRACGLEPALMPFPLARVIPHDAYLEIEGTRVEGVPLFDAAFTAPQGVRGAIGPAGSDAPIGLLESPVNAPLAADLIVQRRADCHVALVVVTRGRSPGLAPINAESFVAPFGPPALQVSSDVGAWMSERAAAGATARLVAHAERTDCEAYNVVARLRGRRPELPPLVVMTPRSGWWECASERGGGIACWLETMRVIQERGSARDVLFVASSGHELGHLGLKAFMAQHAGLGRDAHAWVHFGANIGAAHEGGTRIAASDDALEQAVVQALEAEGTPPAALIPRGTMTNGEAREVHREGGRYVSLVGGNALFHLAADRWPDAVDPDAIAAHARASAGAAAALAEDA